MKKWQKIAIASAVGALAFTGIGIAVAGPIACFLGSTGILGAASTGTAISSLSGVALTNASLASLGGGAIAAGGLGIAGGTTAVVGSMGLTGAVISGAVANIDDDDDKEGNGCLAKI